VVFKLSLVYILAVNKKNLNIVCMYWSLKSCLLTAWGNSMFAFLNKWLCI